MTTFQAPDLANGAIFHNEHTDNAWVTEIQAVLVERRGERERTLYLAHECRKERLPFCNGALGGGADIFMREKPHDFLTFSVDGRFWEIPHLDTVISHNAVQETEIIQLHNSFFMLPTTKPGWLSRVRCSSVTATPMSWSEVHQQLADGTLVPRQLFCRFAWTDDAMDRELYYPVRYINFPTRPEAGSYLQPISGTVLVPFRHSFLPAYIACSMAENGEMITEFLVARYVDPIDWLARGYGFDSTTAPFAKLSEIMPAYVRVFDSVRKVSGRLTFFSYGDAVPARGRP